MLDLGGESTRPGSDAVSLEEELRRVMPVLEPLCRMDMIPISIDTSKSRVAELALDRGASIVNDVTALRADPEMALVIARSGAGVVLMHMQGQPKTMQQNPRYDDVVTEVLDFLAERVAWAMSQGIARSPHRRRSGHRLRQDARAQPSALAEPRSICNPGLRGRRRHFAQGLSRCVSGRGTSERMVASTVSSLAACAAGAGVVRVHDVAAMIDAIKVWTALRGWESSP